MLRSLELYCLQGADLRELASCFRFLVWLSVWPGPDLFYARSGLYVLLADSRSLPQVWVWHFHLWLRGSAVLHDYLSMLFPQRARDAHS